MLLKLYDMEHRAVAGLKNHRDARVESALEGGDRTLYFLWHQRNRTEVPLEYYIRTDRDEYVVKENSKAAGGYRQVVARLNLEGLEGRAWREFTAEGATAGQMAEYALSGTGWTCTSDIPEGRLRSIRMRNTSAYGVIMRIVEAFFCEVEFDTIHKAVSLKQRVGEDRGAYFIRGLNLLELTDRADSYDYATRIIPIGADGLGIESVNGGVPYLENHQHSPKDKCVIWEDSSYTDPNDLKEDAERKLAEISQPKRTLQARTADLARMKPGYGMLAYSVGDTVTLVDSEAGIREKQRVVRTVEYLESPQKDTCDISNTALSFEEMQKRLFAAAECLGNITTGNGTVKGSSVDRIDVTQIIGMDKYITEDADEIQAGHIYAKEELGAPVAVIGSGTFTSIVTTSLDVQGRADIQEAHVGELHADMQYAEHARFKTVESENIAALEARVDKITSSAISTDYLEANYAKVDCANVDTASIRQGFLQSLMVSQGMVADRVQAGEVIATNVLTGVRIDASDIAVGRLDAANIEVTNLNAASITVGAINGHQIAQGAISLDKLDEEFSGTISSVGRDVQQALEDAGLAAEAASAAQSAADTANTAAGNAKKAADAAQSTADTANTAAGNAKKAADTAQSTANTANTAAGNAKKAADTAQSTANTANTAAGNAKKAADTAQSTADAAKNTAESVQTELGKTKITIGGVEKEVQQALKDAGLAAEAASAAQTTADMAATAAGTAKSAADTAQSAADTANIAAGNAKKAADAAQSTADTANTAAGNAKKAADTAQSTANTANTAAGNAKKAADTAQGTADAAKSTAENVQAELGKAKTAISGVEKEVQQALEDAGLASEAASAAQSAADTAAIAAGNAKKAADTAQSTANTANTAAGNAQKAADTAQATADTANTAAGNAKKAADTAQSTADMANTAAGNAQKAADTANTTAGNAKKAADAAQGTADAANVAAGAAQTAANNAQSTANAAKTAAGTAQATADGKNTVFYQAAPPPTSGRKANDVWFDTDDGNRMYFFDGKAWAQKQFGTNAIANAAITNALIADATITSAKISQLDAGKITSGYISADRIKSGAVTADKIAANAVTADKIAANAITADKIASNAVTVGNLDSNLRNTIDYTRLMSVGFASGRLVYKDCNFANGRNSVTAYNNSNNGTVTVERINKPSDCPNTSGYCMQIKHTGVASPGYGGFVQLIHTRPGAHFLVKYIIKLPLGYRINVAANVMGNSPTDRWLTDTEGTGKYTEYVREVICGTAGAFSTGGFVYITSSGGAAPSSTLPLVWYLSYIGLYDVTECEKDMEGTLAALCKDSNMTYIDGGKIYARSITAEQLAANSVISEKIISGAVTATKIATNAVTAEKVAANAITAEKIISGAVTAIKIAADAVEADKIAANAVTADKIEASAVTADKIEASAVTAEKLAAGAVTAEKVAANAITAEKIISGAVTAIKIAADAVEADKIAANAVTADKIDASAVTAEKLAAEAVTAGKIAASAVKAENIASNAIIAEKIISGAVTTAKLSTDAVTADKIAANAVTAGKISAGAVTATKIATNAVTAEKIASSAVTADKIAARTITAGKIVSGSLTSTEINVSNLVSDGLIGANKLKAANIDVSSLFAQTITASGSIQSSNYAYTSGNYSTKGIRLVMSTGQLISKKFAIDSSGNAYYAGNISGATISGSSISAGTITGASISGGTVTGTTISGGEISSTGSIKAGGVVYEEKTHIKDGHITNSGYNGGRERELSMANGLLNVGLKDDTYKTSIRAEAFTVYKGSGGVFTINAEGNRLSTSLDASFSGIVEIDGSILPSADNAKNMGSSSKMWNKVYARSLVIRNSYSSEGSIGGVWKDGASHAALLMDSTGLNTCLGWAGSSTYKTAVILRGQSVRLGSTTGTVVTSDERLKNSFQDLGRYEGFFDKLEPYAFKYNDGTSGRYHCGFKAQQVLAALEASGLTTQDFAGFVRFPVSSGSEEYHGFDEEYGVIYTEFIPLLVHVVQKGKEEIAAYRQEAGKRMAELEAYGQEARERMASMEEELQQLREALAGISGRKEAA